MKEHLLKLAFYVAKWNYSGICNEFEFDKLVSKEIDLDTFNSIKNEIRSIIYKDDKKDLKPSNFALEACKLCENKTISQCRFEVKYILNKLD